jgi:hypothetical protein
MLKCLLLFVNSTKKRKNKEINYLNQPNTHQIWVQGNDDLSILTLSSCIGIILKLENFAYLEKFLSI